LLTFLTTAALLLGAPPAHAAPPEVPAIPVGAFGWPLGGVPIGAIVGWLLILLAADGHLAAALLLPLYYLLDATVTLLRRWRRGEKLSEAHRSHFYQIATTRGFTVPEVTWRIFTLNLALVALATITILADRLAVSIGALAVGATLTAVLMACSMVDDLVEDSDVMKV
jgi:nicotinamide riboside transporter PnuC